MNGHEALDRALDDVGRPLRGLRGLTWVLAGITAALLAFALVAWWARVSRTDPVGTVLLVWGVAIALLGAGWWCARRTIRAMGPWWIASRLEESGAWRHGALTNVLDPAAAGTSAALRAAAEAGRSAEVRDRGIDALHPVVLRARRASRYALGASAGAALLLLAARPLSGTPAQLWNPLAAWSALTSPVTLVPRSGSVARGEAAQLDLTATGHRTAMLYTRLPGEAWQARPVALDADGHALFTTVPLNAELTARLEAGGRSSAEARVTIRLPAFLGSFTVTAHYPAYLGLEPEALPVAGDTLVLPAGTRLDLGGRATVALSEATITGPGGSTTLVVDGLSFRGALTPLVSGRWQLDVRPAGGASLDGEAPFLPVKIMPDSAPVVEIPSPGVDTVAGPALQLPLLVALRDDHGLSGAAIEMQRGHAPEIIRAPLQLGGGTPDRALLPASIDLSLLGLHPGDTLHYTAVATDNTPGRQTGRSRTYWVRIPTEGERRTAQDAATHATGRGLDSLAANAAKAQRQTEDLARERNRADTTSRAGGSSTEPMSADAARRAEAVAQAQEQLQQDAARVEQSLDQLRQAAEKQGLADSAFARQLDDIRRLMQQADSPELREAMQAMQEALKQLDPEATRTAMQELAQRQAEYRNAMEQAKELFKRAAMEADLSNLEQAAKQLGDAQRDLTPKLAQAAAQQADAVRRSPDSAATQAIVQQQALAQRADSLGAALDRAAQKVPSDSARKGLQQNADQARDAGRQMQQAAQSAQQGQPQPAREKAKEAEKQLSQLEQEVKENRQELQEQMKEEVLRALDRALEETARLAQRQVAMTAAFRNAGGGVANRAEQALLDDAVGRIIAQVAVIAGRNAMVPQQIGVALAAARVNIRSAIEAISSMSPDDQTAISESGEAVDALTVAGFAMLRAKDRVSGSASGSGMEEAMKEMQQAAEQQGKAAKQSGQQMQSGQAGLQQLMEMAAQQRAIASQLERLRAGGQMPGAGMMAKEAKELTREIEAGQLSRETVDRQEKLYKKMLDAGRQLQGEQDDDEKRRTSTTAADAPAHLPPALDPKLRIGDDGIRLPSWESLQRLSPEERRRVLEYFQRLTEVKRT